MGQGLLLQYNLEILLLLLSEVKMTKHMTFNIQHIDVGRTTQQLQWSKSAPSQAAETLKLDVECNGVCFKLMYVSYDDSSTMSEVFHT